MPLDNKISNIIGTKLPKWVLDQLETRANKNTQDSRDNDNILFLTNKSAWVRLVSSVNIGYEDLNYFKTIVGANLETDQVFGYLIKPDSLAKQYVLYGGTSKYLNNNSYGLRSGLDPDGAYGMLGKGEVQDFGYKPMPGITSVNIDTQGRLGSVRAATINFKCWDKNQLDIIDALYFKLGFTMFLEWGHTYYYPSAQNSQQRDPNKIISTELYSIDPFEQGLNKEDIQIKIAQNSRDTEGNYDAMLGICTNFNFTYTQDGGYDCTLRLMGLGVLGDSIKINNAGTLPGLLIEEIIQLNNTLIEVSKAVDAANGAASGTNTTQDSNDIKSYPACIQNLPNVSVVDVSKSKTPAAFKRLDTFAALGEVEGQQIYFYLDGQYQTTGFSKSGRWECVDGKVVLDGIKSILGYLNSEINGKTTDPNLSELGKIVQEAGYPGSKTVSVDDYNFLKNVRGTRGNTLFFPSFGAIVPTENINDLVSSITIDSNYLFQKISQFLDFEQVQQQRIPAPINTPTIPGTQIPTATSLAQSGLSRLAANTTLESLMFSSRQATNTPAFIRLDINYTGANTKRYYASLRVEFARNNPQFKKEALNEQAVYEEAIKKFKSNPNIEFTTIGFEARPVVENTPITPYPFGRVLEDTNSAGGKYPVIKLSTTVQVSVPGTVLTSKATEERTLQVAEKGNISVPVTIDLLITDTDLVSNIKKSTIAPNYARTKKDLENQNTQQVVQEEPQKFDKEAVATQVKQSLNYQSTLEIMLRTIQVHALNKAINNRNKDLEIGRETYVLEIADLNDAPGGTPFLQQIFSTGIFSSFIQDLIDDKNNKIPDSIYTTDKKMVAKDRFKIQSKYGFASSLLANKVPIALIKPVNFKEVLKAYVVPYQINQEIIKGTYTNHPVYIPLGLVLMILNHACTIYDTKEGGDFQTPLVYIDFNPETNFCLTNGKQLSTDPWTCLIPFEGSFSDYKSLFDNKILTKDETAIDHVSGSSETIPLFNPETQDFLSGTLPTLKFQSKPISVSKAVFPALSAFLNSQLTTDESPYRGKMMNILLNIDYLVKLAQQYSYKDGTNSVYLKTFLEQILSDVNKSLGNFNSFRLSYNDQANTFQIIDDQFVPGLSSEEQVTPKSNTTELPLLGKFSIAKSLEIKSEVSSRLSNMLAISANANYQNKATLSTNGDPFGFINTAYVDRYITNRGEITGSIERNNDTLKISAAQFNNAISDFYSKINPSQTTVSHATNYYIEKMTLVKNKEYATRASAMIPVSVNFTTDGISGMAMGQAFTVPDKLLPYTYTTRKIPNAPTDHINNVGFVVVGLTHTIDNNQWNTAVRANMIFLKDKTEFTGSVVKVNTRTGQFGINEFNEFSVSTTQTNFVAENKDARIAAESYLGRTITDTEWSQLVAATFAEASGNQTERAWVMAVILNRTRTKFGGATSITDTLTRKNQFQAVTGTSQNGNKPSEAYVKGPGESAASSIYGAATNILTSVPKNYLYFTSNNPAAYGPGTNIAFLDNLKNKPGSRIIGGTVFSITA